jgi:hypothetical protein
LGKINLLGLFFGSGLTLDRLNFGFKTPTPFFGVSSFFGSSVGFFNKIDMLSKKSVLIW